MSIRTREARHAWRTQRFANGDRFQPVAEPAPNEVTFDGVHQLARSYNTSAMSLIPAVTSVEVRRSRKKWFFIHSKDFPKEIITELSKPGVDVVYCHIDPYAKREEDKLRIVSDRNAKGPNGFNFNMLNWDERLIVRKSVLDAIKGGRPLALLVDCDPPPHSPFATLGYGIYVTGDYQRYGEHAQARVLLELRTKTSDFGLRTG